MILGLGHPRTGTGFTSKLCKIWGLDVGHEEMGADGTICWHLVVSEGPYPFSHLIKQQMTKRPDYDTLVYNVRNPRDSLASIMYTEDTNKPSLKFRQSLFTIPFEHRLERSIASLIAFDDIISELNPDITFRIEDQQEVLFEGLKSRGYDVTYKKWDTPVNTRHHMSIDDALSYYDVSQEHRILVNNLCDKYGYPPIDFKGGYSKT